MLLNQLAKKITAGDKYSDVVWGFKSNTNNTIVFCKEQPTELDHSNNEFNFYIIWGKGDSKKQNVIYIEGDDFLNLQKEVLNIVFPIDWSEKCLMGITGTNGKTSVANFTEQLLNLNGVSAFSVGTLGVKSENKLIDSIGGMTTPGLIDLHKCLHKHLKSHDVAVIEVSSHGVALKRILGLNFDVVAWTNFTQDHLDFHETLENYFQAKKVFFVDYCKEGGKRFVSDSDPELLEKLSSIPFEKTSCLPEELEGALSTRLNSGFNLKNIELAYKLVQTQKEQVKHFDKLRPVPGRFQIIDKVSKTYIVDYAHTPDALENVLVAVKNSFPQKKIHVLFGCGGERDRGKRPLMGKIADEKSDFIYITNDNPRSEDPFFIIKDILKGIGKKNYSVIHDRRSAIKLAVRCLPENACLIIAGKGHEDYQLIGKERLYFNDLEILREMV